MSEGMIDLDLGFDLGNGIGRVGRRLDVPRGDLLDDLGATVVPQWVEEDIPQRGLMSVYDGPEKLIEQPPIAVCPDSSTGILWFRPTQLALTDFALTVRREVRADGSVAITGGSAVLSLSVYIGGFERVAHDRWEWAKLIALPEAGVLAYAILPATQYGLTASLELPAGVASAGPIITVSPLGGAATIAIELTESGVLTWRSALEQGAGSSIPGTVRATTSVPTVDSETFFPGTETFVLDTAVGTLLASRGPADIRQIDPQQAVAVTVVVVGSQLVDTTTVVLRPAGELAPTSAVFGPGGGHTTATVVTQQPAAVRVDWHVAVAFTPPRWPVVPASGTLDVHSGWITMIKPESWCVGYVLTVVPVDASGRPVPAASRAGDRVQGVLNFSASYVTGELLSTAFEAEYARPSSLVLPRFPDQPFGHLVVTVFVTVRGQLGQASRPLGPDDVVVTALAYPDGRVELHTATESLPEASTGLAAAMRRLTVLARG